MALVCIIHTLTHSSYNKQQKLYNTVVHIKKSIALCVGGNFEYLMMKIHIQSFLTPFLIGASIPIVYYTMFLSIVGDEFYYGPQLIKGVFYLVKKMEEVTNTLP